jgi:hypothetical protein
MMNTILLKEYLYVRFTSPSTHIDWRVCPWPSQFLSYVEYHFMQWDLLWVTQASQLFQNNGRRRVKCTANVVVFIKIPFEFR